MAVNVEQLRRAIADLPGDMPVLIAGECGAGDEPNLYVIPARIEYSTYGSHVCEGHRHPSRAPSGWRAAMDAKHGRRVENCTALLLSEWGNDDGEDITPRRDRPTVIDADSATPAVSATPVATPSVETES